MDLFLVEVGEQAFLLLTQPAALLVEFLTVAGIAFYVRKIRRVGSNGGSRRSDTWR